MTPHLLRKHEPKEVRETLNRAIEIAETARHLELDLIQVLREIDKKKFYVRYGYRSLSGFCRRALRLSRLRAQSIVIEVRRDGEPWSPPSDDHLEDSNSSIDGAESSSTESDKHSASFWPF